MKWENKATNRSLRLGAYNSDKALYYEIGLHAQYKTLYIECENISQGKRIYSKPLTVTELLKEFPSLVEHETILRAYEMIAEYKFLDLKRYAEISIAQKEYNSLTEGFRKQFLEGYLKGLGFRDN